MADKPRPMTDDALLQILRREEQASKSYQDGTLSPLRLEATNYYDRQPYGDEQDGASQVVTSEVQDVIESLMPGLMRVFTGSDNLATFMPMEPGQEKWASEANTYVPHVLMRENPGFRLISDLLKDALLSRLSGINVDTEEHEVKRSTTVQGLTQDAIDQVIAQAEEKGADLVMELEPDAPTAAMPGETLPAIVETFSGTITTTLKRDRVVVDGIAPEDIRFSPLARSEDDASCIGYQRRTTASDLRRLGLTDADIEEMSAERPVNPEEDEASTTEARSDDDDSERTYWIVVSYVRADVDGDGVSELMRVVWAHGGRDTAGIVIEKMEWEGPASIALATPILMPHAIVGRSLFDQTKDLQQLGSVLFRGMLDNLYQVNRPRPVISDQVNLDSLIDWVPGAPVTLAAGAKPIDGHVEWLKVPSITGEVLPALEYLSSVKENRTGVSRYNQGLDADSLNKTLGGLDRIMSASGQRQDLIARVFAETAIKRLYRLIYRAIKRVATGPVSYWKGEGWAHCDPSQWPEEMDLTIDVAGISNAEQTLQRLLTIVSSQEKLVALQGGQANGPYVTADNIANIAQKIAETLGYKTPGTFFQPAEKVVQATKMTQGQGPQQPSPEMAAAQGLIAVEQAKAEGEIRIKEQKNAADIRLEREKAAARLEIMREENALKLDLQQQQAELDAELKQQELNAETHLKAVEIVTDANRQPQETNIAEQQVGEGGAAPAPGPVNGAQPKPAGRVPRRRLGDTDPALLDAMKNQSLVLAQMAQSLGTLGEGMKAMAAAHLSDTEVTTSTGKTVRARRIPRGLN